MRPNAPSYNGARERFSLRLAPCRTASVEGPPPERLRADAEAFFHPPAVVVRTAGGVRLPRELRAEVVAHRAAVAVRRGGRLPAPRAFLANPTGGDVDLVWDAPRDPRLEGYEIEWRAAKASAWERVRIAPGP